MLGLSRQDRNVVMAFLAMVTVGSGVVWMKSGRWYAASPESLQLQVHPRPVSVPSRAAIEPIDMNTASPEAWERLPNIGPTLARRIVQDRAQRGPFASVNDLARVRGIGPKMLEKLTPFLICGSREGVSLNSELLTLNSGFKKP